MFWCDDCGVMWPRRELDATTVCPACDRTLLNPISSEVLAGSAVAIPVALAEACAVVLAQHDRDLADRLRDQIRLLNPAGAR